MLLSLLSAGFIIIALVYLAISRQFGDILDVLKSINIFFLFLSIFFIFASMIILALRWNMISKEIGANKTRKFGMLVGISSLGNLLNLVTPVKSGYYIKVPILKSIECLQFKSVVAAVNIETLSDFIYILSLVPVYFIVMALSLQQDSFVTIVLYLLLIVFFLMFLSMTLTQIFLKKVPLISNLKPEYFGFALPFLMKLAGLVESTKELITKKGLLNKSLIFTLFSQLTGVFGVYLLVFAIGEKMSFVYFFYSFTISYMIGILSMLPGGIGTTDFSLVVLLQSGGLALPDAVVIAILSRVIIYCLSALLAISFVITYYSFIKNLTKYEINEQDIEFTTK
ncbi:MAG: lysylphosphatidylglycerol synthase transmembrane domain-containing protein [Candidatus Methanoperedens sp.]|nr:lysylphosphatidylglycerol synthase transmembrane domain-containing protein [Candidatus Methanoperedens sp.]